MKAFVMSHFSYCLLTWVFHSRNVEHDINKLRKKDLKLSPNLRFDELLGKDKSMSIHKRNLQVLSTDIAKVKNGILPELMSDFFEFVKKPYSLRETSKL